MIILVWNSKQHGKQLDKLNREIEDILARDIRLSRSQIEILMANINRPLRTQVLKLIESSRQNEATMADFELSALEISSMGKETLDEICGRLEDVETTKVSSRQTNDEYNKAIKKLIKAVTDKYNEQFKNDRSLRENICRKIEDATDELIKNHSNWSEATNEIINTRLQGIQEQIIAEMEKTAIIVDKDGKRHEITDPEKIAEIDKIDSKLSSKFIDSTGSTPTSMTGVDEQGNVHTTKDPDEINKVEAEVSKAAKTFNDFASSLQSQTKSFDEVARSDAESLSENQKTAKDTRDRDDI